MNYVHHALIGVGTAGLGLAAAEMLGMPPAPLLALGMGALVIATGSIAYKNRVLGMCGEAAHTQNANYYSSNYTYDPANPG